MHHMSLLCNTDGLHLHTTQRYPVVGYMLYVYIYINPEIIVNTYYVGSLNPDGAVNGAIVVLRLFAYLIPRGYTRKGVRACYNGVY